MAGTEDPRGSAPALSTRDLLLELYHDMKVVRPSVEMLVAANLPSRVQALELDHAVRDAKGVGHERVAARLESLEDTRRDAKVVSGARKQIGDMSIRTLAAIVVGANFVLGLWVALANVLSTGHP